MKLLKNLVALSLITYLTFFLLDLIFTEVFKKGYYNKTQWINKIENQKFDYIIHGNSRAYTTLDVGIINKETNLKGLNLSVDGSSITEQALMLDLFMAKGNKIKTLFLEIDYWFDSTAMTSSLNLETVSKFDLPKFFPYLKDNMVFDHYKDFGIKWYAYRYIPFYRYAEFNSIWGPHEVIVDLFHVVKPEYDENGGHFYSNYDYHGTKKMDKLSFNPNGRFKYFNRIVNNCKKNNIKLVCFTSPISFLKEDEKYTQSMKSLEKMLQKNDIKFYNFSLIFAGKYSMFVDELHLNMNGVRAYHPYIKDMVQQNVK